MDNVIQFGGRAKPTAEPGRPTGVTCYTWGELLRNVLLYLLERGELDAARGVLADLAARLDTLPLPLELAGEAQSEQDDTGTDTQDVLDDDLAELAGLLGKLEAGAQALLDVVDAHRDVLRTGEAQAVEVARGFVAEARSSRLSQDRVAHYRPNAQGD
jgi:hypothetical protein